MSGALQPGDFATRVDLTGLLTRATEMFADNPAISAGGRTLTYSALAAASSAVAHELVRRGVGAGARVALIGPGGPDWATAFFGAVGSGAVVAPLDPRLTPVELACVLEHCRPALVLAPRTLDVPGRLAFEDFAELPRAHATGLPAERDMREPVIIGYTSGSSGEPKGVQLSLRNILFQVERLRDALGSNPDDTFLSVLPPNHLLELTGGLLGPLFCGSRVVMCPSLLPSDIALLMGRERPTVMITVPLLLRAIMNALRRKPGCVPLDSLRFFVCGGAALDPEIESFFESAGTPVLQGYGLTETGPVISVNTPAARRARSVGRPLEGVEVCVRRGRIHTRGPHVMLGYLGGEPAEDWFDTGDLGHVDDDGFLYVTGRAKNVIVLGSGKNVQPEEVELQLEGLNTVTETCIVGAAYHDGPLKGSEQVCAVVVTDTALEDVRSELAQRLHAVADYKRPTRVVPHVGPLPRTAARKLKRDVIRGWLEGQTP